MLDSASRSKFGLRPLTIALATIFIATLLGLLSLDRALRRADEAQLHQGATEAKVLVETFLAVRAEALTAFRGLYLTPGETPSRERFAQLVAALGEHLNGFRRVYVTDSSGVVVHEVLFRTPPGPPLPAGLDVDTVSALQLRDAMRRARITRRTQFSAPGTLPTGERGFVIVDPQFVHGRFAGYAVGSVPTLTLAARLPHQGGGGRRGITLLAGRDTVVRAAPAGAGALTRTLPYPVSLPGGQSWVVEVSHGTMTHSARVTLWGLGLFTLGAVMLWVVNERRQAWRLAERSAELERLSAELLRANRAKSEFLANVSHELRTPLNAIVGFADLLRDGVYGELGPRQVGPVQRIEASANHLRHLVDQILDLAKMAAGRLEVHTDIVDLRPFVLDVATEVESLVSEKGLQLSLAVPATLPRVRTDPNHLRQILVNLLGNAVKYTDVGGVVVRARLVGPAAAARLVRRPGRADEQPLGAAGAPRADALWVALQVADTGIGIAEGDRERVFDEFEQVNAGPRGDSMRRGTGLGLAISRRLARLLDGDLTLESTLGKGSTFTLWLPVNPADLREEGRGSRSRGLTGSQQVVAQA